MLRVLGHACAMFFRFISATGKIFSPIVKAKRRTASLCGAQASLPDDVVFRAIRELGDVFPALLVDDQDVVFTIPAGTWKAFWQHDHRLNGNHHPRLQHCVDVFAQFQAGFAAVVMAQRTEGVTVAEGAVLQQIVLQEDLVQLQRDIAAAHTRLDQFEAGLVHFDVNFPQAQMLVGAMVQEQRTFQRV